MDETVNLVAQGYRLGACALHSFVRVYLCAAAASADEDRNVSIPSVSTRNVPRLRVLSDRCECTPLKVDLFNIVLLIVYAKDGRYNRLILCV